MRTDDELRALTARMLDANSSPRVARAIATARAPRLLKLPTPRRVAWVFRRAPAAVTPVVRRLLEQGELVWALRLEGEARPYEETGADDFVVGFRHPRTGAIELRRFRATTIDETEGLASLVFPLVVDPDSGDALPWSFIGIDERGSEIAAGLAEPAPPPMPAPPLNNETRIDAALSEQRALALLNEGAPEQAVRLLVAVSDLYLSTNDRDQARRVLARAAFVLRQLDAIESAMGLATRALELGLPPAEADFDLATLAGVCDRAGDRRAAALWRTAAETFERKQPLMRINCLAHAAGADHLHGVPHALARAREALAALPPSAPVGLRAGLLGAIGDSAGARGVPFLAQAVMSMARDPGALNDSTVDYLELLITRIGLTSRAASPLLALGVVLATKHPTQTDLLMREVARISMRCAAARGIGHREHAAEVKAAAAGIPTVVKMLEGVVEPELWLIAPPNQA